MLFSDEYGMDIINDLDRKYRLCVVKKKLEMRGGETDVAEMVCFPEADILLLGVSDRSHQEDGAFETMPAVLALLHTQRQIARKTGIPFWNTFGGMGGENSMVRFVENNWASKDYTHLSFRGGREIATALLKALLLEKEFYDEADKVVN